MMAKGAVEVTPMTHSDQLDQLASALAKAQGEIQNVVKDAKNPHYKSDYATLDAVTDTVRPIFAKHGLSVVQMPSFANGVVTVDTMLLHSSGQWIHGVPAAPLEKPNAQGVGSATTYLRRYSLAGTAAIAQTDDDGTAAQNGADDITHEVETAPAEYQPEQGDEPPHPAAQGEWPTDVGVHVVEAKIAKRGQNARGPWTLYAVRFSNGREGTTFEKNIYDSAKYAVEAGIAVQPVIVGKNLTSLRVSQ